MIAAPATAALQFAPKFAALGHEVRLAIVRLLLSANPDGLVVGEIQEALDIPPSTLSHHLDGLQREGLVAVTREGKYLRYRADAVGLRNLLAVLHAECCTRSKLVPVNPAAWPRSWPHRPTPNERIPRAVRLQRLGQPPGVRRRGRVVRRSL